MYTGYKPLNQRQRKYLEGIAQGMTKGEAARFANYSPNSRPALIERSSQLKAQFSRLIRIAAPAHKLAKVIENGLNATKTIPFGEGEPLEVADYKERREYAVLAAKWGEYTDAEKANSQVNVGVTVMNGVTAPRRENGE